MLLEGYCTQDSHRRKARALANGKEIKAIHCRGNSTGKWYGKRGNNIHGKQKKVVESTGLVGGEDSTRVRYITSEMLGKGMNFIKGASWRF